MSLNLFATVLTYPAPSANYRGESELNRTVIQKVTDGRFDYPIISPEAMRNALREMLAENGLPSNRERLPDEDQLAVRFNSLPDPEAFVDDFVFGYLVAASKADRAKYRDQIAKDRGKDVADRFTFKRDSVLRMNLAKALEPYRHNAIFTQSPLAAQDSAYQNATTSALLHRETCDTPFQYPFALNQDDCLLLAPGPNGRRPVGGDGTPIPHPYGEEWTRKLLEAIGELNGVSGNHARSYYEMAPSSILIRVTTQRVAGYGTYGFQVCRDPHDDQQRTHSFPEVVDGILHDPTPDYPGSEFFLGGKIVKDMSDEVVSRLQERGVTLDREPRRVLDAAADRFLSKENR